MKLDTFRYLIKDGFRNLSQNAFMTMASVLVLISCLLLTGSAYLVYENVEHGFEWAYQQNVVVAYAHTAVTDDQAVAMEAQLKAIDNVAEVHFISKEDLLDRYREEFGDLLEDLENDNPLQDAFVISFKDLSLFDHTVAAVKGIAGVETVDYDQALSKSLVQVRDTVLTIGGWVIALLLIVSLFIISNTIKLTVYSRRLEISIMRSVGATRAFIRFPFMVEGVLLGCIAGILSYGLVFGLYTLLGDNFTFGANFSLLPFTAVWWQLLVGFLAGGTIIGMLGSTISTGRYLKEQG